MISSVAQRKQKTFDVIRLLRNRVKGMAKPAADSIVDRYGRNPFLLLISCLLSLRARDVASLPASLALFKLAQTPEELLSIPLEKLEKIIYSVGFYRKKARHLHSVCRELIDRFNGVVPSTEQELLSIKGIGRKTANLVLGLGFGIPAICVDTHVHRLSNKLGLVDTKTPEETERELKNIIPKKDWIEFNKLMVTWGQNNTRATEVSNLFEDNRIQSC